LKPFAGTSWQGLALVLKKSFRLTSPNLEVYLCLVSSFINNMLMKTTSTQVVMRRLRLILES